MTTEQQQVCDFCGGNCGQCGTSVGMGVPPSMDRMIVSLNNQRTARVVANDIQVQSALPWTWWLKYAVGGVACFIVGLCVSYWWSI